MTAVVTPLRGEALAELKALQARHPFWGNALFRASDAGHLTREDFELVFSQYSLYSQSFTRCLAAVMANCDDDLFRARLTENLWDEGGGADPARRHTELFRRFLSEGLGVQRAKVEHQDFTRYFVREYLDFCLTASPVESSAFLSLGTEGIVPRMYGHFLKGLSEAGVAAEHLEFFRIHIEDDDKHAATLEALMLSYADQPGWFDTCRRAMEHALDLRLRFFENLYQAVQARRVAGILGQVQARVSLAPILSAGTSQLKASLTLDRRLYSNKNDRLNIEFTVDGVPFSPEVLDPRVVRIPAGKHNEHHKHAHETIFYIVEGTGRVLVDDESIPVKPGDVVFVPRWAMHQSQNKGATQMTILAITDFNFTRKAFIGDYLKTARQRRSDRTRHGTRDASWDLPPEEREV